MPSETLEPGVRIKKVGHFDASHSMPVLKISPLIFILPLSAPCQVRGLAARKINSWPSEMIVTVSPFTAAAFIRGKFRWNSRELTVMSDNVSDSVGKVNWERL